MACRYTKHYSLDEARALLPDLRVWLEQLAEGRLQIHEAERQMTELLGEGKDVGGPTVTGWLRRLAQVKVLIEQFHSRQIEVKDLERGLVDFPAFIGGKEVYLCWKKDEEDITFWHELNEGFAGRQPIEESGESSAQ